MHTHDGHWLAFIALFNRRQGRQDVDAVYAAVGPEVIDEHFAFQLPATFLSFHNVLQVFIYVM